MSDASHGAAGGPTARVARLRARWPVVDHGVRAYGRYAESRGDQLAAAMTFFGFLSFFPLLALAFALLGYVVEVAPDARAEVAGLLRDTLPGLVGTGEGQIDVSRIADARAGAGLLGLLGLLWAGTGWVDAVRESLRAVFSTGRPTMKLPVRKAWDVAILAALGTAVLVSLAFSGVVTSAAGAVLATVDLDGSVVAEVSVRALTLALVLGADVLVFAILFVRLPGHRPPWRQVWSGAFVGAVGFELLKLAGTFLVARTTHNPVYAGVAVAVGLLVWTNLVSRVVVFAAAWTATQASGAETATQATGAGTATRAMADVGQATPAPVAPPPRILPTGPGRGPRGRRRTVTVTAVAGAVVVLSAAVWRRARA